LLVTPLAGCSSTGNTKVFDIPLSPEEIDEVQAVADDRPGVLRLATDAESELPATVVSVTSDSLQYSPTESQTLVWNSLGEVSRVEFPHSTTYRVAWGAVGGAVGGALGVLGYVALVGLALCSDDTYTCDPDWGGAAVKGALVGGIIGVVMGLLVPDDAPAFEFYD
jgi:hypothetical protein